MRNMTKKYSRFDFFQMTQKCFQTLWGVTTTSKLSILGIFLAPMSSRLRDDGVFGVKLLTLLLHFSYEFGHMSTPMHPTPI